MKVFTDIGEALTLKSAAQKQARRIEESDLSLIHDAVLVCHNGLIQWIGPRSEYNPKSFSQLGEPQVISLGGRTILPAFVEPHTHLIFAGARSEEFEWRIQGETYQNIAAKGGGILSTVKATRRASESELLNRAQERAAAFVRQGVATLEVKSGYGLDLETELKCLRAARNLKGPQVVSTYLGLHSRSPDFADLNAYVDFVCEQVLPEVARLKLADRVDIYIEKGFYSVEQGRRYFEKARELGLPIVAHVEQLSRVGGLEAALDHHALSVDHVVYANEDDVARVAKSGTTAVLLPTSDFYLRMAYPPARRLIEAGARVALATDFNPGTSPTQSLSFVGVLARLEMKMSLPEVITAYTLGAAYALNVESLKGSLTEQKACDFSVLTGSWRELFYSVGANSIHSVYRGGDCLFDGQ